jgi:recombination protein RecA
MKTMERAGLLLRMGRHLPLPRPPVQRDRVEGMGGLSRAELAGRLVELSGHGDTAVLTHAFSVVLDAQREGETVAWITRRERPFYPPDVVEMGVDLSAVAVVRCPDGRTVASAADRLARSGAFGLLVLDLGEEGEVPSALLTRLAGLAHRHDIAILFLTEKPEDAPSVGPIVSLRGSSRRLGMVDGRFVCRFRAVKDKQRGPGWAREELYHGPPGLC